MYNDEARSAIHAEFDLGEKARAEGLEGRARVCARRAAGVAIKEYARIHQISIPGASAYDLLSFIRNSTTFSTEIQRVADHLMTRVNEEFKLPPDIDLLSEARWLVEALQSEAI